ncbi:hypothetical protein B6V01_001735 [Methanosarcinales archaeon ex4572_44]|nr:MAG: hypothetical protein B6U67_03025 [Methanosarcinales archaeon ex4484_138]PHP45912.1 MAG: hypothetical protein B6V01_001735 [Methanosarcinales archaeon ex4572_44]RLG26720.1 MAG: hypothetical protein DRN85_02200 [Methanosarcinales archaeon]RLG27476.1 MAG: hypothetical protein DRN70_02125 [Methanosarcinales archaeon]HHI30780.1 ArsR family transcriptional regulator [Candidatus Methanoperedenaceae archaeon]
MNPTKSKIMEALNEASEPMSIGEIANTIDVSWATAKTNVLELSQDELLNIKKFGKNWIIWVDASNETMETCTKYRR